MFEPRIRVQASFSVPLANRVMECMKVFGLKTMDNALRQLVEIGLRTVENANRVDTPDKVLELMKEFEEGDIVTYVSKLDQRALDILFSIVQNERNDRYGGNRK